MTRISICRKRGAVCVFDGIGKRKKHNTTVLEGFYAIAIMQWQHYKEKEMNLEHIFSPRPPDLPLYTFNNT